MDQAELRPRRVFHLELHLSHRARHPAQEGPGGPGAQVVAVLVGVQGHRLGQGGHAAFGPDGRLQGHRVLEVSAGDLGRGWRGDGPMAGILVEQPGEHGGPVEPGQAEPVDRALLADQRGRVTVREQGVIGDRSLAHDPLPVV